MSITLLYIAGYNYSGSTLLAFLLNAHPRMGSTGEIGGPPGFSRAKPFACSCGSPIRDCPFYRDIAAGIASRQFSLDENRWHTQAVPHPPGPLARLSCGSLRNTACERVRDRLRSFIPSARRYFEDTALLCERFIQTAASRLQTEILADSSKNPMQIPLLAAIPGIRLKAIHLVRHPAGCALSAAKHNGHSYRLAAHIWKRNYDTCVRQMTRFAKDSWMRVRYEDLCLHPREVLTGVCAFAGVPFDETMLAFRSAEHHIVGNDMRLRSAADIVLDERWKETLSDTDIGAVLSIADSEARACGYLAGAIR